jgi:GDP-D-mannose dehydratase
VKILQGDATKAKIKLKWSTESSFNDLVKEMVDGDLEWYKSQ